jgi:hypothetical protein
MRHRRGRSVMVGAGVAGRGRTSASRGGWGRGVAIRSSSGVRVPSALTSNQRSARRMVRANSGPVARSARGARAAAMPVAACVEEGGHIAGGEGGVGGCALIEAQEGDGAGDIGPCRCGSGSGRWFRARAGSGCRPGRSGRPRRARRGRRGASRWRRGRCCRFRPRGPARRPGRPAAGGRGPNRAGRAWGHFVGLLARLGRGLHAGEEFGLFLGGGIVALGRAAAGLVERVVAVFCGFGIAVLAVVHGSGLSGKRRGTRLGTPLWISMGLAIRPATGRCPCRRRRGLSRRRSTCPSSPVRRRSA